MRGSSHRQGKAVKEINVPLPRSLKACADYVINSELVRILESRRIDFKVFDKILAEAYIALADPKLSPDAKKASYTVPV